MIVSELPDVLNKFIRNYLRHVHTIKIAKVSSVNHKKKVLSAKILTDTYYASGVNREQPDVIDVPFFILSANKGEAKVTLPVSSGDLVIVLFSDRDYENYLDTSGQNKVSSKNLRTHDYNPILALPCFYTSSGNIDVSPTDIVVANKTTQISLKPDGDIELTTSTNVNVECATANVNATTGVNVTSPTSTFNGNVIVTGSLTAATVVGTTSVSDSVGTMQVIRDIYNAHTSHPPNNM